MSRDVPYPKLRRSLERLLCVTLWPLITVGCDAGGPDYSGPFVTDSAGIRIVENEAPLWPSGGGWRIEVEPSLTYGHAEGDAPYQLFRVVGATILPDGRIVVANSGTSELRFFDEEGVFLTSAGGEGEGPGFFQFLAGVSRYRGDSLATFDIRLDRVSIFDGQGRFARSFNLAGHAGLSPSPLGSLSDGSFVLMAPRYRTPDGAALDSAYCLRFSPDGSGVDTVTLLPDQERYGFSIGEAFMSGSVAFTPLAVGAAAGDHIYLGHTADYSVGVHALDGTVERIVRRRFESRAVLPADVERFKDRILERRRSQPDRQRMFRQVWERVDFPDVMPAYDDFRIDSEGNLWVADYRPEGESVSSWTVFDPEGQMLGSIDMPDRLRVFEIGPDYLLGVWFDDFDVPQVRIHRLIKD